MDNLFLYLCTKFKTFFLGLNLFDFKKSNSLAFEQNCAKIVQNCANLCDVSLLGRYHNVGIEKNRADEEKVGDFIVGIAVFCHYADNGEKHGFWARSPLLSAIATF